MACQSWLVLMDRGRAGHLTPSSSLKATISSGMVNSLCALLPSHCPRSADSLTAARTSSGRMMRASRAACTWPSNRGLS